MALMKLKVLTVLRVLFEIRNYITERNKYLETYYLDQKLSLHVLLDEGAATLLKTLCLNIIGTRRNLFHGCDAIKA